VQADAAPQQEESVEILLEMARSGEIDPWNIDIIDVTDRFLAKLVEREKVDLRASARTLLYASILLRMKSDILVNAPPPEPEDEPLEFGIEPDELPALEPRHRQSSVRPVTLQELIMELQRAVATRDISHMRKSLRIEKPRGKTIEDVLSIAHEEDIERSILELGSRLDREFAYREFVMFSELVSDSTPRGIVDVYLPLLFLASRRYVMLIQEEIFEDIIIRRAGQIG
jgi:segregation and condensation protein A